MLRGNCTAQTNDKCYEAHRLDPFANASAISFSVFYKAIHKSWTQSEELPPVPVNPLPF